MSGVARPGDAQAPAVAPEQAGPAWAQAPGAPVGRTFDFPIRPLSTSGAAWQPPMAPAYSQASVQAPSPLQSMFQYQRMLQPSLNMQGLPAVMQQAIPSYLRGGVK